LKRLLPALFFLLIGYSTFSQDLSELEEKLKQSRQLMYKQPSKALEISLEAFSLSKVLENKAYEAESQKLIGNCNYLLGNYAEALSAFKNAQLIYMELQDSSFIAQMYSSSALVHKATKEYDKALEMYPLAYSYLGEHGSKVVRAKILNNEGTVRRLIGDYDRAEELFFESLTIKKELKDNKGVANSFTNLGNLMVNKGDNEKAIEYFNESLTVEKSLNNTEGVAKNLNNLGNLYLIMGQYNQAIKYADQGLKIGEILGTKIQISEATQVLATAYENIGNYKLAYKYFRMASVYKDSLYNEKEARKIGRLEAKLSIAQQDAEIEKLKLEGELKDANLAKSRNGQLAIAIGGLMLIAVVAVYFVQRNKKLKAEAEAQELQIEALEKRFMELNISPTTEDATIEKLNEKIRTPLTEREFQVLSQSFRGKTNSEIAEAVFLSVSTVKFHLRNVYGKLGVHNRREALDYVAKSS